MYVIHIVSYSLYERTWEPKREKFDSEYATGVIRNRNLKDRQYYDQKKKDKTQTMVVTKYHTKNEILTTTYPNRWLSCFVPKG